MFIIPLLILLLVSSLQAKDLFTIEALGERIGFEARIDRHTLTHFVIAQGLSAGLNLCFKPRDVYLGLGTAIIAFEFGQATLGGRVGLIDIGVGFAGMYLGKILINNIFR